MRAGYTASVIGHLAILGIGYFGLPNADPFQAEAIDALPVELVTVADVTDLMEGDKEAEELPPEKPQPKPVAEAEAPAPKPAEDPAEKPVEAAQAPSAPPPPPPPPEPEPEVEPEPEPELEQLAALPEPEPAPEPEPEPAVEPEPEPAPEPEVASPPRLPKSRPKPPKQVSQPKPKLKKTEPKADPLRELALKSGEEFNPDDISALLNKQEPTGGGDPMPATEPQTLGSTTGRVDAAMTQTWLAALTSKLAKCWSPPVGAREAGALVVTVSMNMLPDGSLAGTPVPTQVMGVSDPQALAATDAALRAVAQCAPYNDVFPAEHYDQWKSIVIEFDPSKMLGAG